MREVYFALKAPFFCVFVTPDEKGFQIHECFFDTIFHLDVHYVCMLVQRFELQGRRSLQISIIIIISYVILLCRRGRCSSGGLC